MTPTPTAHIMTKAIVRSLQEGAKLAAQPWKRKRPELSRLEETFRALAASAVNAAVAGSSAREITSAVNAARFSLIEKFRQEGDADAKADRDLALARTEPISTQMAEAIARRCDGYESAATAQHPSAAVSKLRELSSRTQLGDEDVPLLVTMMGHVRWFDQRDENRLDLVPEPELEGDPRVIRLEWSDRSLYLVARTGTDRDPEYFERNGKLYREPQAEPEVDSGGDAVVGYGAKV